MKRIFGNIILALSYAALCCAGSSRNFADPDPMISRRETLNYEFGNRYYAEELKAQHFLVNIEIDPPAVIETGEALTSDIYAATAVSGLAVVRFSADRDGRIGKWEIRKRAGLGLDKYVETIIGKMKIQPAYHRGEPGTSEFYARFVFRPR